MPASRSMINQITTDVIFAHYTVCRISHEQHDTVAAADARYIYLWNSFMLEDVVSLL